MILYASTCCFGLAGFQAVISIAGVPTEWHRLSRMTVRTALDALHQDDESEIPGGGIKMGGQGRPFFCLPELEGAQ